MSQIDEAALKQAARDLLAALESDSPLKEARAKVRRAKDHLAAIAVLWAQSEIIEALDQQRECVHR